MRGGSYDIYSFDDDTPYTPPPQHWTYYLAMLLITPIKAITPLSWFISLIQAWRYIIILPSHLPSTTTTTTSTVTHWEIALTLWVVIEVLFSLYHTILVTMVSNRAHNYNMTPADPDFIQNQLYRILHYYGLSPGGTLSSSLSAEPPSSTATTTTTRRCTSPPLPPPPSLPSSSSSSTPIYSPPSPPESSPKSLVNNNLNNHHHNNNNNHRPLLLDTMIPSAILERSDPRAMEFRNSLRTWFHKRPWSSISRGSVRLWLGWSIFNEDYRRMVVGVPGVPGGGGAKEGEREGGDDDDGGKKKKVELIEEVLGVIERRAGARFLEKEEEAGPSIGGDAAADAGGGKEGEGGGEKSWKPPLRVSLDPLGVESRPFVVYCVVYLVEFVVLGWFEWKYGLKRERIGGLEYLIRIPHHVKQSRTRIVIPSKASSEKKKKNNNNNNNSNNKNNANHRIVEEEEEEERTTPILFLHGLGIGPSQYFIFIHSLLTDRALSNRIILIPIQPYVSQRVFHSRHVSPFSKEEIVGDLCGLICKVGGMVGMGDKPRVTVISHSNGTSLHAWLVKSHPELVYRSCFVDPVIFCLWEGDVCYNFVYKTPNDGLGALVKYFVASEIGIANYVQRHFDWSANTLFVEDIPNPHLPYYTLVFLSASDSILSVERVRRYFASHGLTNAENLFFHEGAIHGQAIVLGGRGLSVIMDWLRDTTGGDKRRCALTGS